MVIEKAQRTGKEAQEERRGEGQREEDEGRAVRLRNEERQKEEMVIGETSTALRSHDLLVVLAECWRR